ncbi:hypothetical protein AAFC00_005833 [Neodothiora populina]|uniref:SET domain-containing protein n=1 Tax=Neodothiora populina TaxID=2781224 RepID=A0ABR3P605_9PEZI
MPPKKRQLKTSSTSPSEYESDSSSRAKDLKRSRNRKTSDHSTSENTENDESNDNDATTLDPDPKHKLYTEWATSTGITISSIAPITLSGRGTGLLATTPIRANQKLISVPPTSMLKPPTSFLTSQHPSLKSASPQAQLAAYLTLAARESPAPPVWYQRSESVWPSFDDFRSCMIALGDDAREVEVLKRNAPPGVLRPLERLEQDLERDLRDVAGLFSVAATETQGRDGSGVKNEKEHGEQEVNGKVTSSSDPEWKQSFVYHWILVNTRSFHWKPHGVREGSMVMCPFLDYMNHCPNGQGCTVTVSTHGYELTANKDYKPGDEILATYGAHPNDKLLVHYGFILPDSPDDEIRLDHVILSRMTESQQSTLQDVGFLGGYALDPTTNELCFKTQVAIRSVLLTANEWEHYMGSGEDLASDKEGEVYAWLRPALDEYAAQAESAIERLVSLRKDVKSSNTAFESKLALLQARWVQIQQALERFMSQSYAD